MSLSYLKRAEQGNRSALSFIATICLCIGGLVLAQYYPVIVVAKLKNKLSIDPPVNLDTIQEAINYLPYPLSFSLIMLGFLALLLLLLVSIKFIHQRKFATLWSDQDKFRWKEFAAGIIITLVLAVGSDVVAHYISPHEHTWVFNQTKFIWFLPVALIFIPIQTLSEEVFFRGYLYQMFGLVFKNAWPALIASSIIFGAFHFGNAEMGISFWKMAVVYIGSGLMIGLSVLLSKGIEFGWGFHLINNLYLSLITSFPGSSLDGPTIFSVPKPSADRVLVEFAIQFLVFTTVLLIRYRKNVKGLFAKSL